MIAQWREYYDEMIAVEPKIPKWLIVIFVTWATIWIPVLVWWDCDFHLFRWKVKIVLRKFFFRMLFGG